MIKSQLMLNLAAQNPYLFQRDVQRVVDAILDEIVAALVRGDRVELRGFGTFAVKVREGRIGRNPRSALQFAYLKKGSLILGRATKCVSV